MSPFDPTIGVYGFENFTFISGMLFLLHLPYLYNLGGGDGHADIYSENFEFSTWGFLKAL